MDPALVIFVIESAIRLGRKLLEVLVDETQERALILPVGSLLQDVKVTRAKEYFLDHPELTDPGGPYTDLNDAQLVEAYKTLIVIDERIGGDGDSLADAREVVLGLHAFEQLNAGFGAKPALQRILGTVVEIGIDWFATHPEAIGKDSSARKIVQEFVRRLDDVDFADGTPQEIVGRVLVAALGTLDENATLLDDDARLATLLGGVTKAVAAELASADDPASLTRRGDLVKRIGSAILRGGATAFVEHTDLFIQRDDEARTLVQSTLAQVLEGVRDQPNLFTNEALEGMFSTALVAAGSNASQLVPRPVLRDLIADTVKVLTRQQAAGALFSRATVAGVVQEALAVAGDHMDDLLAPTGPRARLFADSLASLAHGMSDELGANEPLRLLVTPRLAIDLARLVFDAAAERPELLLDGVDDDARRTALAQIVGSVALALGRDPAKLVSGQGLLDLARIALDVGTRNVGGLLDLQHADPRTNLLARSLTELVTGVAASPDPRRLLGRNAVVELARRVLPIVSAHAGVLAGADPLVRQSVQAGLVLANGALAGRTDADVLPALVAGLLRRAVWKRLDLGDGAAVEATALEILEAA